MLGKQAGYSGVWAWEFTSKPSFHPIPTQKHSTLSVFSGAESIPWISPLYILLEIRFDVKSVKSKWRFISRGLIVFN